MKPGGPLIEKPASRHGLAPPVFLDRDVPGHHQLPACSDPISPPPGPPAESPQPAPHQISFSGLSPRDTHQTSPPTRFSAGSGPANAPSSHWCKRDSGIRRSRELSGSILPWSLGLTGCAALTFWTTSECSESRPDIKASGVAPDSVPITHAIPLPSPQPQPGSPWRPHSVVFSRLSDWNRVSHG